MIYDSRSQTSKATGSSPLCTLHFYDLERNTFNKYSKYESRIICLYIYISHLPIQTCTKQKTYQIRDQLHEKLFVVIVLPIHLMVVPLIYTDS